MTILDAKFLAKVLKILNKYGTDTTFKVVSGGTYSPTTGTTTGSTTTSHTIKASPPSVEYSIDSGEESIIIAAKDLPFTPYVRQEVVIKGESYWTTKLIPLYSGDSIAAYEIGVKK